MTLLWPLIAVCDLPEAVLFSCPVLGAGVAVGSWVWFKMVLFGELGSLSLSSSVLMGSQSQGCGNGGRLISQDLVNLESLIEPCAEPTSSSSLSQATSMHGPVQ